ncbi:hypothetical protein Tsubulata_023950, partial [Turnera subulata]
LLAFSALLSSSKNLLFPLKETFFSDGDIGQSKLSLLQFRRNGNDYISSPGKDQKGDSQNQKLYISLASYLQIMEYIHTSRTWREEALVMLLTEDREHR